ncbi:MAG: glucose-6-phosphate dehydrogenase assembly protein OpcA, partial [Cyanobacteria bacterium P01_F01_bin.42]
MQSELNHIWETASAKQNGDNSTATRASTFSLLIYEPSEAQILLKDLGYYSGPVDGIFGPRMQAALHSAQETLGLPEGNYATPELIQKLKSASTLDSGPPQAHLFRQDADGSGIADVIAVQNPCRIVSIFPTHDPQEEEVSAQVSAYCPVQKKKRSSLICCEYIALNGAAEALNNVTSLIQSLLISELPKFLWWKSDPNHQPDLFKKLSPACNSIVFDSSGFEDPAAGLQSMAELVQQKFNIADLNWKRLAPWQELTAEAFDPPSRRSALLEVDRITLDYEAGNPAQALLFMGWLGSRLQWSPQSCVQESGDYQIIRIKFQAPNQREIEAELAALPVGDVGEIPGDLIDLKLASTNLEADCCTVLCSQTTGCMRMEAGGGAQSCRVQQVTSLLDQKPELLLSQHLQRWARDALFEESLKVTQVNDGL